jgi:hypothetical protein
MGEIEWLPFAIPNTAPAPQPPAGIAHHFCRLALLSLDAKKAWTIADDCRPLFPRHRTMLHGRRVARRRLAGHRTIVFGRYLHQGGLRIRLLPRPIRRVSRATRRKWRSMFPNSIGVARVYLVEQSRVTRRTIASSSDADREHRYGNDDRNHNRNDDRQSNAIPETLTATVVTGPRVTNAGA